MTKFRVPVRVSVAPVYTYERFVTIEANSRLEAARKIRQEIGLLDDLISRAGWKPIRPDLPDYIQPHLTTYDTYLNGDMLDEWVKADSTAKPE